MGALRRRSVILLLTLAAVYLALVLLLAAFQDVLVFPGAGRGDRGVAAFGDQVREGRLRAPDGTHFRIVTVTPRGPAQAVAVYFVGNGEDLTSAAASAVVLAGYGLEVIGVEYPGYGQSEGRPTVDSILAAADTAAGHAAERARELNLPLIAIGNSLGTFAAVHVATGGDVARLLLRAPPTTLRAAAQRRFFWLPVGLFLRHAFDSLGKAAAVRCPTLVLHGDRDTLVPLALGRELAAAFAGPTELIVAEGYGHNDLPLDPDGPFGARIGAFLAGR